MEQRREPESQGGEKSLPPPPGSAGPFSGGREAGAGPVGGTSWWLCTHEGVGLPCCPTCDGRLEEDARTAPRQARAVIGLLLSRLEEPGLSLGCAIHGDALEASVESVEPDGTLCASSHPCPRCMASSAQAGL